MGCVDQSVEFVLVTPDLLETAQSTPSLMSYPPSYVSGVETESVRHDVHHAMLAIIIRVGNSGARAAAAAAASITSSAAPPPLKSEAFTQLPATLQSALYLFLPLFPVPPSNVPTTCAALCSYAWLHDRDRDEG